MSTIGQKLGKTRRTKGLSVEDIAHATRIHPNIIWSIEDDDFSQFPSVAYARGFIRKYSEHLDVDLSSAIKSLNSGTNSPLGGGSLLGQKAKTGYKDRYFRLERLFRIPRRRFVKSGRAPLLLNGILFLLIFSLGIFYFLGYNARTIEEAQANITKGLQKAIPFSENPEDTDTVLPALVEDPAENSKPAATVSQTSVDTVPEPQTPAVPPLPAVPGVPAPPVPAAPGAVRNGESPPQVPLRAVPITKAE